MIRHTRTVFEVERMTDPTDQRIVDFAAPSCSCGFFAEYGIPCRHLCAASLLMHQHPQRFVAPERTLDALRATYVGFITPIDMSDLADDGMKPPQETKRRGRPKRARIRSAAEKKPRRANGANESQGQHERTTKK